MLKRNLNEVLGFISRWGESKFSLRLLDEALSAAGLEAAANEAEKVDPKGIRARQLRAKAQQRRKREDSILDFATDPATDPDKSKKASDLLGKMRLPTNYDPDLEGQKKDPATGEITVGGKKATLTKSQEPKELGAFGKFLGVLHPSTAGKPGSLKQLGKELASGAGEGIGKTLGLVPRVLSIGSSAISAGRNLGSMIAEPAGQDNYSTGLLGLGGNLEAIRRVVSGGKIPLTGIRHGGRHYSHETINNLVRSLQQNKK
jgi:hypothetical protein